MPVCLKEDAPIGRVLEWYAMGAEQLCTHRFLIFKMYWKLLTPHKL